MIGLSLIKPCRIFNKAGLVQYGTEQYGLISVSGQLLTYPSPNPTLTLTCYQLTLVELGGGRWAVVQILILIQRGYTDIDPTIQRQLSLPSILKRSHDGSVSRKMQHRNQSKRELVKIRKKSSA